MLETLITKKVGGYSSHDYKQNGVYARFKARLTFKLVRVGNEGKHVV